MQTINNTKPVLEVDAQISIATINFMYILGVSKYTTIRAREKYAASHPKPDKRKCPSLTTVHSTPSLFIPSNSEKTS